MSTPIRVFIGSSSNGEDAEIECAYEYTLRKNTASDLEIVWMRQTNDTSSFWNGWDTSLWSTPFSGFRWGIPEYCGYSGKAIYTDCDMLNYRDIKSLIELDMKGKPLAARKGVRFGGHEFCVMVIDCEAMKPVLGPIETFKRIPTAHRQMIQGLSGNDNFVESLEPKWNCLDGEAYSLDEIYQLHFTNMSTQPWKPSWYTGVTKTHQRPDVVQAFYDTLAEAEKNGYSAKARRESLQQEIVQYNIMGR